MVVVVDLLESFASGSRREIWGRMRNLREMTASTDLIAYPVNMVLLMMVELRESRASHHEAPYSIEDYLRHREN